jgi:hypothetical protein
MAVFDNVDSEILIRPADLAGRRIAREKPAPDAIR